MARCPAHADRTPSLSIWDKGDGRILVNCFGQDCAFPDIVAAVGMSVGDMFPPRPLRVEGYRSERRRVFPADVFHIIATESLVVRLIALDMIKQRSISELDVERLAVAEERLGRIAEAAYGSR
jgi:hypothetical protein